MSRATDVLRRELDQRRDHLAELQRQMTALATAIESQERELERCRLLREEAGRGVRRETEAIDALDRALAILAEGMPVELEPASRPSVPPVVVPRAPLPTEPSALRILQMAEEMNLGHVSDRTRRRAETVRAILMDRDGQVQQQDILAGMRSQEPTEQKALTAVQVGLALLVAEKRARCTRAAEEYWELTPPERASASLGVRPQDFQGRTTRWPGPPRKGERITLEEGSYEGGKKR